MSHMNGASVQSNVSKMLVHNFKNLCRGANILFVYTADANLCVESEVHNFQAPFLCACHIYK